MVYVVMYAVGTELSDKLFVSSRAVPYREPWTFPCTWDVLLINERLLKSAHLFLTVECSGGRQLEGRKGGGEKGVLVLLDLNLWL